MSKASKFAAVAAVLVASHEVADHWVQSDSDAVAKGADGPEGVTACLRHVATYTVTQAVALWAADRALGLRLRPGRVAAGLAVSAVTHYIADRSGGRWRDEELRGLPKLAAATGHAGWLQRDPAAGYALDQSWHKGWIAIAAAVAAGGGT